jgi:hypothetical protein
LRHTKPEARERRAALNDQIAPDDRRLSAATPRRSLKRHVPIPTGVARLIRTGLLGWSLMAPSDITDDRLNGYATATRIA